jgi:DUF1365 family protein
VTHELTYPCAFFHLDLDALPELARRLCLFGHDRPNLISFFDRDHADGRPGHTKPKIDRLLRRNGIDLEGGKIFLLTQCRMFHYVFNPVSFYYCHGPQDALRAVVVEVNSTFGERHFYVLPADGSGRRVLRADAKKELHVSPFLSMDAHYDFRLTRPDARVTVSITEHERGQHVLDAVLTAERHELNDRNLMWLCARYPFLTLRVIAGIHGQALRLWRKGAPFHRQPPPTAEARRRREEIGS